MPLVIGVTSHRNIPATEIEPIRQRERGRITYREKVPPGKFIK